MRMVQMYVQITGAVVVLLLAVAVMRADTKTTLDGWVSDANCGAMVNATCAKACVQDGVRIVFVKSDRTVLRVANPDALKGHEGDHVKVEGKVDNGVLTVSSVKTVVEKPASK